MDAVSAREPRRVQLLSEAGLSSLPPEYVQRPACRPAALVRRDPPGLPVVDLAANPVAGIARGCRDWGAFQVVNHGVPHALLDEMRRVGLQFFRSPTEEKLRYACDPGSAASEGYGSQMLSAAGDGSVLDWRDYFDHHTLPASRRNPNRWPDFIPGYRDIIVEYSNRMKDLAKKLLSLISESLGLPSSYIEERIGEVYQNITISYYSPCPQPELALGLQSHSDIGAITLLIQDDVGGLEVLKDGEWVLAQPLHDAIVVILADQTEIISNGLYKSAEHRVIVNAHRARLSVSTFYDPSKTKKIFPAPELISECSPQKYRDVIYGEYLSSWYKGPEGKRNIDTLLIHQ